VTAASRRGAIVGTFAYMSPEQSRGAPVDARTDIWAFGCILFELLTGRAPFARATAADTMASILEREPDFSALPSWTPPTIRALLRRCLQKDRTRRPDDLEAALNDIAEERDLLDPSIAVLPFANLSADKENEYFSDGLTEEIINLLARVPTVKVTARTSSFAFRGKEDDIRKIAAVLGVRAVLEGSVRRAANRIRVTAQLINADDGYQLWSERYDRELADIFAIQDEIAAAICAALERKLTPVPAVQGRYIPNLPAYDAFLQGQHWLARITPDSLTQSQECFEKAIALDGSYAMAHVGSAMSLLLRATYEIQPAHEALPQARVAAARALQLDPVLPEARVVLGVISAVYEYDWNEADRHFRHAMARQRVSGLTGPLFLGGAVVALLMEAGCGIPREHLPGRPRDPRAHLAHHAAHSFDDRRGGAGDGGTDPHHMGVSTMRRRECRNRHRIVRLRIARSLEPARAAPAHASPPIQSIAVHARRS
jgi:eukaryotic-like serine/threonine-protein kinase